MAEKCANCHNNFSLRSDGKGFTRHSMTAKLRNITVADAISICCSKDVTPRKRADLLFLCPECFRLLRDLYDKTIATDTFTTRTAEDSYMHKKRTRTPTQTPRAIKKRMISTPLKKTPLVCCNVHVIRRALLFFVFTSMSCCISRCGILLKNALNRYHMNKIVKTIQRVPNDSYFTLCFLFYLL